MDLKKTVNTILVAGRARSSTKGSWHARARGKTLTDEMAEHVVQELRPKHPVLAAVVP